MRFIFISLMLYLLYSDNLLLGNISSIEQKFVYSLISARQDTTLKDTINIIPETIVENIKAISPGKALMYSAALPGFGQAYVNNWKLNKRVLFFTAVEALSLWTWYTNDRLGEKKKSEYESYADERWSFSRWLHDYYIWDNDEDEMRIAFINIKTGQYSNFWDTASHSINFSCNNNAECDQSYYRTSSDQFAALYNTLCGGLNSAGTCSNSIDSIDQQLEDYKIDIEKGHHYYENIGKYDNFFAGWADNDDIYIFEKSSGELIAKSPNKHRYREDWLEANEKYFKVASFSLSVIVANHAVSMLEALISTKLLNMKNKIALSSHLFYNPKNKWGIGGIKISFKL